MSATGTKSMPPPLAKAAAQKPTNTATSPLTMREIAFQPPRIVLHAVEGWGKTSTAAFAPDAAIIMARGETGYDTLLGGQRVPQVLATVAETWTDLLGLLDALIAEPSPSCKTLALDAAGGIERLCHEHVCARDFGNDWGERGFSAYQKGYDVAVTDWLAMLNKLDALKGRGVSVVILSHCAVRNFKNPLGADYDRYISDVHNKTWAVTSRWADAVLFGNFLTILDKQDGREKGIGGTERVLYAERRDAYDAKNRYGMPAQMKIPNDPAQVWPTIWSAITGKEV